MTHCLTNKVIGIVTAVNLKVRGLSGSNVSSDLGQGLESLAMELHNPPPMILHSRPRSGSFHSGSRHFAQAHVQWSRRALDTFEPRVTVVGCVLRQYSEAASLAALRSDPSETSPVVARIRKR